MFYYKLPTTLLRPHQKEVIDLMQIVVISYTAKSRTARTDD
ncbi:hypothetical protein ACFFU1_00595 [Algibacter miyuki]|uniref:Transposase n=1 Tax=Algibacter miyuki TaxID=1306933 RepID=A0ABV5GUS0_9FLAO|nr:hypothetical protein [Algibacter miyuki]MDN3664708.1 hypothetical protein [Algibacter miyuki]